MPTSTSSSTDEAQIRARLNRWTQALYARDIDALMSLYATDTITFDLMPPSQVQGAARYRQNFERWFAAMSGPIAYEMHDLRITMSAEVAFCHSVSHIKATRANGEPANYWVRVTVGFQKRNGQWMMIHDHVSMPFDMQTMKAVSDLQR